MTLFSEALKRGESRAHPARADGMGGDVFTVAYLGSLDDNELEAFRHFHRAASRESFKDYLFRGLMSAFAVQNRVGPGASGLLGCDVRLWPALAKDLEQKGLLPEIRRWQASYRREIHRSLWSVIADLYDAHQYTRADIADFLAGYGL